MKEHSTPRLTLEPHEIHLWMTSPGEILDETLLGRYSALMTEEETRKQQRFLSQHHRHSALITRAFVRDLLSAYAPVAPQDWRFQANANGKPEIVEAPLPLRFNLSHTRNRVVCAVTLSTDIGCDVESVARRNNIEAIAETHFSRPELAELHSLPAGDRRSRFFDYWTLKESYIKACGEGLFQVPLGDFSFHIGPSTSAGQNDNISLSFAPGIAEDPARWRSWLFYPGNEHRVAVSVRRRAADSPRETFRCFDSVPLVARKERDW